MADFFVIAIAAGTDGDAEWLIVGSDGTRKSDVGRGTLTAASSAAAALPVIVLVPAADVVTAVVDLPVKSGPKLRAAIPFALEELFASDIEELHFAHGAPLADGKRPVAVVATARLSGWLAALADAGIEAQRVIPAYHGVQRMPNTITLLAERDSVMLNDGAAIELALEGVDPADALRLAGLLPDGGTASQDDDEAPGRHLVAWCDAAAAARYEQQFNALRRELASVDVRVMAEGALPRLAASVATGAGIDLLQGEYARRSGFGALLRPWRAAAGLLLALVLVALAGKGVDFLSLSRQEAALSERYAVLYQSVTGDRHVPGDPLGAVQSLSRRYGSDSAPRPVFLPLILELARAIGGNDDTAIEALSYRAGIIDLRLTAPDVATLDLIQKHIGDSGRYAASIQGTAQSEDGKIASRLQIRGSGA